MLIVGARYRDILESGLQELGQSVFWLSDNSNIDERLAGHVDLSIFRPNEHTLVIAEGVYDILVNFLTNAAKATIENYTFYKGAPQGRNYPADAGLCVCTNGKYTIYNPKTIDPAAKALLSGIPIEVPQGYTKCSVCVVSDDAIITADDVIFSRACRAGMDVLKISPGGIQLTGYDHGFIGGATFLLDENVLAFTGTLDEHPDKDIICAFLRKHHVKPVFLTKDPIFDMGGAIRL